MHRRDNGQAPNVVMICTDQWRADCLGVEGHPCIDTPYLDMLAGSGARFRRAYAATPSCIAARASLYTGLTPRSHRRVGYQDGVDWEYPVTIASVFRGQGYQTHAVGKMHVHPARLRLGFDSVDLHDGYVHFGRDRTKYDLERVDDYLPWLRQRAGADADYFDQGTNCNAYTPHPWDKEEMLHPTAWVSTMGADFLRRRDPTRPFFLMLSYHRPHPPLDPPAWAYQQYLQSEVPSPVVGDWVDDVYGESYSATGCMQGARPWPAEKIRRARAAYYGQITFIDHQIHRFMELLAEYRLAGNTVFCFTSDHGECLGDHHLYAKSVAYEPSARVPLLFFSRNRDLVPHGVVDTEHVMELRDVMPTLLDIAGLAIPDTVEGRSALPLLRGTATEWREYIHGEHDIASAGIASMHYIVTRGWKYIWHSGTGREQLFCLDDDPWELHDLARAGSRPAVLAELRRHLVRELTGREEGFVLDGTLVAGRKVLRVLSATPRVHD